MKFRTFWTDNSFFFKWFQLLIDSNIMLMILQNCKKSFVIFPYGNKTVLSIVLLTINNIKTQRLVSIIGHWSWKLIITT